MPGPRVAYLLLWFPDSRAFPDLCAGRSQHPGAPGPGRQGLHPLRAPARDPPGGMAEVLAPVRHLGTAALPRLVRDLLRLGRTWGPGAARFCGGGGAPVAQPGDRGEALWASFLRRVGCGAGAAWRTGGEALWAGLAGVHLAGIMTADGIDHIHAPWANGPATAAWVASRLSGIPFSFSGRAHGPLSSRRGLLEKLTAAALVRTENLSNLRYLAALYPQAAGKLVNIYPGVPMEKAQVQAIPAPRPYRLLAVGRFVRKKGFPLLLEACRLLAAQEVDFQLTLAGGGPEGLRLQNSSKKII